MSKTSAGSSVRTFLAVCIPEEERARLAGLDRRFGPSLHLLKWVSSDLLHITVRFLGAVAAARLHEVEEATSLAASRHGEFSLGISGIGAFPGERSPRVIWAGLERDEGYEGLQRLFDAVEDALAARGFPREERRFSPHITLARTRDSVTSGDRRALAETLRQVQADTDVRGVFAVRDLVLMRSDLGRGGPTYTPMLIAPLRR